MERRSGTSGGGMAYEGGWAADSLREMLSHDLVVAREKSRIRPESERRSEEHRSSGEERNQAGIFDAGFKFLSPP